MSSHQQARRQEQTTPTLQSPPQRENDLGPAQLVEQTGGNSEISTPMLDAAARSVAPAGAPNAAPDSDSFSEAFNDEFAAQLHVFNVGEDQTAAERGPDVNSAHVGRASGEGLTATQLQELFTASQREKLASFISSRRIPDRLFNGDDANHTTAQQRILLSGHILASGEYEPGSFSQRVHARMCGHWVNLVQHYAGVGDAGGRGIREQFDHEGNLSLGTGNREGWTGARIQDDEYEEGDTRPERSRFQLRGLSMERLDGLQAGDWIWYFNDNGGAGGNHSLIFSRWAGPVETATDPETHQTTPFRRAICMSQRSTRAGGVEHTALLGESFQRNAQNHRITPVTHFSRVSEDANPIRTGEDLRAVLGTGGDAVRNQRFIDRLLRRHPDQRIDFEALSNDIRARNTALLRQLRAAHSDRMTDGQVQAIEELNAAALRDNNANTDVTTLCRLHDRLEAWLANANTLEEGEEAQTSRVETRREHTLEQTAPQREALEVELEGYDEEIAGYEETQRTQTAEMNRLDVSGDLRAANRVRARLRADRRHARQERRGTRDPAERAAITGRLQTIATNLERADAECERLADQRGENRAGFREARRTARQQNRLIARVNSRRRRAQARLDRLEAQSGTYQTHSGDRRAFQGRDESREARSGLLQELRPQPTWSALMIARQGE